MVTALVVFGWVIGYIATLASAIVESRKSESCDAAVRLPEVCIWLVLLWPLFGCMALAFCLADHTRSATGGKG